MTKGLKGFGVKTKTAVKLIVFAALAALIVGAVFWYVHGHPLALFNPAGEVGHRQRNLIVFALSLSLVVVVPVFVMLFAIAWRYREGNKKSKYSPNLASNSWAETVWWLIPTVLILIISVVTWRSSHELDPFRPLASSKKPLTVQVVALDWKWLFIYPEQQVASVNFLQLPIDVPVTFQISADAPMNSFWIPKLGGQMYAMPGMSTQLHLIANSAGDYRGSSANISGRGFATMTFTARASSQADFAAWVASAQAAPKQLTTAAYAELARPSESVPPMLYASPAPHLYDTIMMKYMMPMAGSRSKQAAMPGMEMQ